MYFVSMLASQYTSRMSFTMFQTRECFALRTHLPKRRKHLPQWVRTIENEATRSNHSLITDISIPRITTVPSLIETIDTTPTLFSPNHRLSFPLWPTHALVAGLNPDCTAHRAYQPSSVILQCHTLYQSTDVHSIHLLGPASRPQTLNALDFVSIALWNSAQLVSVTTTVSF